MSSTDIWATIGEAALGLLAFFLGHGWRVRIRNANGDRARLAAAFVIPRYLHSAKGISRTYVAIGWVVTSVGCALTLGVIESVLDFAGLGLKPLSVAFLVVFLVLLCGPLVALVVVRLTARPRRWVLVWPDPGSYEELLDRLEAGERLGPRTGRLSPG